MGVTKSGLSFLMIMLIIFFLTIGVRENVHALESGGIIAGDTATVGETDYEYFNGNAGDRVYLDLENRGGQYGYNPMMRIFDPDYNQIIPYTATDFLDFILPESGEFLVMIADDNMAQTGNYALSLLNLTTGPYDSETDADEGILTSGSIISGSSTNNDWDVFWFSGDAGDRVYIDLENRGGSYGYDVELEIIAPDGTTELASSTGDFHDLVLSQTGEYMVIVNDNDLAQGGNYALSLLNLTTGPYDSETDADEGILTSGSIISGSSTNNDWDVFWFSGDAGDRVYIDLENRGGSYGYDVELEIIAPDGTTELASSTGDFHDLVLSQTGEYMVIVNDNDLAQGGNYALSLLNLTTGPYDSETDADEGILTSGSIISGSSTNNDWDVFWFSGDAGDRVYIDLENRGGSYGYDVELEIIAPDGTTELASSTGDFHDLVLSQTGEYMVIVNDNDLAQGGNYALSLFNFRGETSTPEDCDGGLINPGETIYGSNEVADLDVFLMYGQAGDFTMINVESTGGSYGYSPMVQLIAPDGTDEISWTTDDYNEITLSQNGLYMIIICDNDLAQNGGYGLTLNKLPPAINPGIYNPEPAFDCNQHTTLNLCWDAVAGATGYDIYFKPQGLSPFTQIGSYEIDTCFEVSGLTKDTVYYWYVVAHTSDDDIQSGVNWFATELTGDLNGDCAVGLSDFITFRENYGSSGPIGDLNDDGHVGLSDFVIFRQNYGKSFMCN